MAFFRSLSPRRGRAGAHLASLLGACAAVALAGPALGTPLVLNGGFDSGLTGWITQNMGGTMDPTVVWGLVSPGGPTDPVAHSGSSFGPATRVLFQDFAVPLVGVTNATFQFDFYNGNNSALDSESVNNVVGGNYSGPNIFRIDIIDPVGDVFSNPFLFELFADPGGAVGSQTALVTQVFGDPAGLATFLDSQAGNTLRLRIGHAESTFPWGVEVDNVVLDVNNAPEPNTAALLSLGLVGMALRRRFRSARR